jgi:LuxR family transcriptional regulator, maltose regulon positive regulatory protein
MSAPILTTKLYVPPPQPRAVLRPRLTARLDEGLHRKLTLVCAPAGFGKTTLLSEWLAARPRPAAWLSLEEGDSDPTRFLAYLVAALRTIAANVGEGVLGALQSPQQPPTESILTALLNEITTVSEDFVLVLDDYHAIDAEPVDSALAFVLEHLPPPMHLVVATREDPDLPLARLRGRGQLSEVRAAELRFTPDEAAEFLEGVMGLELSAEHIAALETRTEGWIAGLQLAAISMRGHEDAASFIESFTGSHHFVLDYLVEEVLGQQSESVQTFLLRTSILDHLCGPLCDAVLLDPSASGQATLEYLEHANLFLTPLDNERRWYRYHHLFAELLRQRLHQSAASISGGVAELHVRASQWYEDNGLEMEAFNHAAAANDVERAERLIEGEGVPLHFRGAGAPILNWLESLPTTVLDASPSLWITYASALMVTGQHTAVEQKLQAAEAALQSAEQDDKTRELVGRIASMRATLAVIQHDVETILFQSRRALEYLHPDEQHIRTAATWTLGYAYQLQGDRAAASQAYREVIAAGKSSGDSIYTIAATINLGEVQEADNQLYLANRTYKRVLHLAGDPPDPIACVAYLGLARITYQWNDLDTARQHGQQCLQLTRQMESVDTRAACGVLLARVKLAQGDVPGAAAILAEAEAFARQHNFVFRMPDVAAAQVLTLLRQGNPTVAARLAETHELPISRARVHLAQGDPSAALTLLEPLRRQVEAKGWRDDQLEVMVLQAVALQARGEKDEAAQLLGDALALAEPGGFIRIFVDEGAPMARLLTEAAAHGIMPDYTGKLLAAFEAETHIGEDESYLSSAPTAQSLTAPLSQRELEVLRLIAEGLSNREICERLFLALDTVKGHNRRIFGKLSVGRRTEAVARARSLGILPSQN